MSRLYVGSYTEPQGRAAGITVLSLDPGGAQRAETVAPTASPSFLVRHPDLPMLYCVNEVTDGAVTAFRCEDDALHETGSASTGGADPCHLAVIGGGSFLVAANYTSGSVSVHRLDERGAIKEQTDLVHQHGSGPNLPEWQASAHAHQVVEAPDGSIAVADLGADRIFRYTMDSGRLVPDRRRTIHTPPGDGPRHLVFHPDGPVFVANQLGNTVAAYLPTADGSYEHVAALPVAPPGAPWGEGPAEIVLSPDARTLYVSHRGADIVAVYTVDGAALAPRAQVYSGGGYPRHIALDDGMLWVADRDSDTVVARPVDARTGVPADVAARLSVPSAVCILPTAADA